MRGADAPVLLSFLRLSEIHRYFTNEDAAFAKDPLQLAKSARLATEVMASCKEHLTIMRLNPQVAKETKRICAVVRLCYAYAEDSAAEGGSFQQAVFRCILKLVRGMEVTSSAFAHASHINISTIIQNIEKCASKHMPQDESYMLGMVAWFADFVSW